MKRTQRLLTLLAMLVALSASAGVQLVWNANAPGDGVGKYVVHHGRSVSGPFTNLVETVTTNAPLPRLASGLHVFYVTAISTNGLESDASSQVIAPVPNAPQNVKVVITIEVP